MLVSNVKCLHELVDISFYFQRAYREDPAEYFCLKFLGNFLQKNYLQSFVITF